MRTYIGEVKWFSVLKSSMREFESGNTRICIVANIANTTYVLIGTGLCPDSKYYYIHMYAHV